MSKIIGIDLGTTNSVAAFLDEGRPVVIANAEGERLTPSVAAFTAPPQSPPYQGGDERGGRIGTVPGLTRNGVLVGRDALRQVVSNPERTVSSVKRWMGTGYRFRIDGNVYTPQEISSMVLQKIKADAEAYLGERVEKVVITVPAYFNNDQREATKEAGGLAGLDIVRIINEPTAASLAYGLDKEDIHTILVWDLGGGTFDVSILELGQGVFEVRAVSGDTHLGGDDWDRRIVEYLAEIIRLEGGIDVLGDERAFQRLKGIAEDAKKVLSRESSVNIKIPDYNSNEVHLAVEGFEGLTNRLLQRMVGPTMQALSDARLRPGDIDRVVLVGGATRMPAVQRLAEGIFKDKGKICRDIDPDIVVALGAAIQAGVLTGEVRDVVLADVTPLSLGIEAEGGVFARILERNTPIPVSRSRIFTTANDGQSVVSIHVLQGEREMAKDNASLGVFELTGIPPAPKGSTRIEVKFSIDANGILEVSAADLHTENEQKVAIKSSKAGFPPSSPPPSSSYPPSTHGGGPLY